MVIMNGSRSCASLIVALIMVSGLSAIAGGAAAQSTYLPPFSIYGTPSPPSNQPVLNMTGEYWTSYINEIYYTWFTSSQAVIEALVNGYIQYDAAGVTSIQEYNQLLQYQKTGAVAMNITPVDTMSYVAFNYKIYPFNSVYFRRGIQQLVNYQTISATLDNGVLGVASPYFLFPQVFGSYFSTAEQQAYEQYGSFNLSAAVKDFEAAGLVDHSSQGYWTYPNGTKLGTFDIVTITGYDLSNQVLASLVSEAQAVNISISVSEVGFVTLLDDLLPTQNYQMYWLEVTWSPPTPTQLWEYFGSSAANAEIFHYNDSQAWALLDKLEYDSTTPEQAVNNAAAAATYLQQQLPVVTLWWGSSIAPVGVTDWRGYGFEPPYGILFPSNIHPANATFGELYRIGGGGGGIPDTFNVYSYTAAIDDFFFGLEYPSALSVAYDNPTGYAPAAAYNWSVSPGAGTMPNGHYFNGTVITFNFLNNLVWADGVPFTAQDFNFTLWYLDVGAFLSNPYNPSVDTVDYAPGVTLNYTAEVLAPSPVWFGTAPGLVGSYVPPNNPYEIKVYFNTSSIFNLQDIFGLPILPEHSLYNVPPNVIDHETDPSVYLKQYVPGGPYDFGTWNTVQNYVTVNASQSWPLRNPYTNEMNVTQGANADFVMTVTAYNTSAVATSASGVSAVYSPVDNANGELYVLSSNGQQVLQTIPLQPGPSGKYTASIGTSSLSTGSYYLVAEVNWTGAPYYFYTLGGGTSANSYSYHEYGVLNVAPRVTSQTSPTTQTSSSTSSTGTSSSSSISSTTSSAVNLDYVLLAVIVVIALALVAAGVFYSRRSK